MHRTLTIKTLLICAGVLPMLSACALREPPRDREPDWQNPQRSASTRSQASDGFGADLRLSEFQGARAPSQGPMPARPKPAETQYGWGGEPAWAETEPAFPVAEDAWTSTDVDSGIQPRVYGAPTPSRGAYPDPVPTQNFGRPYSSSDRLPPVDLGVPTRSGLGAGDLVRVTVFGQPDLETSTVVSDVGSLTLPLVGEIQVGGLTTQQAEQLIASAYRGGGYLVDPQITLTVQELRSRQVSVLGQVQQPGRFPLSSRMTLLDALALAGGVSNTGGADIYLIRQVDGRPRKFEINIDKLLAAPGSGNRLELSAGDTIYVPEAPLFYIYGEVRRPDGYALKPGMTVMQAISVGGGLTDRGSDSRLRIRRRDGDGGTFTVRPKLSDPVQEGDVIYVKERLF